MPSALRSLVSSDRKRRLILWAGFGLLLLYIVWINAAYFRAIVVREAATTTWLQVVRTPIDGEIEAAMPRPGEAVGPDGRLASLVNPRADRTALEQALGRLAEEEGRHTRLVAMVAARRSQFEHYAAALKETLDQRIAGHTASLEFVRQRLQIERANAARFTALQSSGGESAAAAEAALARVAALESERLTLEAALKQDYLHRQAVDQGAHFVDDNSEAGWAARLDPLQLTDELATQEAGLATARAVAQAARETYDRRHQAVLTAPSGAVVWNRFAAPGSAVSQGQPVISWIDPGELLVDVPVSDVEAALLRPGMAARVTVEGERTARPGTVLLSRGSSSTLGAAELAAVAKGRRPGIAQVLVRVEPAAGDRRQPLVGRTASVDFPGVGLFSVLRARLRL